MARKYNRNTIEYNMAYNKKHFVRIPLDATIQEYNAFSEYTKSKGKTINGTIRKLMKDYVPDEIMEKHKDDTERM